MSEKVREVFLEVIFKLTVERGGACQMGKARTAECIPSLFVCLFVCTCLVPGGIEGGSVPGLYSWNGWR